MPSRADVGTAPGHGEDQGLNPAGFAYPGGAFNTSIESGVQGCGYNNARTAGSLSQGAAAGTVFSPIGATATGLGYPPS